RSGPLPPPPSGAWGTSLACRREGTPDDRALGAARRRRERGLPGGPGGGGAPPLNALINETGSGLAFGSLVQAGPNSALPHLPPGDRTLAAGDLVLLDFGARHGGYNADTTRMAV